MTSMFWRELKNDFKFAIEYEEKAAFYSYTHSKNNPIEK